MSTIDKLNLKDSTGSGILDLRNVTQINEIKLGNPEEGVVNETFNPLMGAGDGKLKNQAMYMAQKFEKGNFESANNLEAVGACKVSVANNECTITLTNDVEGELITPYLNDRNEKFNFFGTHKYLRVLSVNLNKTGNFYIESGITLTFIIKVQAANQWVQGGRVFITTASGVYRSALYPEDIKKYKKGEYYKVRNSMCIDLTAMGLADVVDDLASFKRLFGYAENEEMPFIPSVTQTVYSDSEGTVRNFPDDKFPFLRMKAVTPPSLTDLNANFHSPVIVPDDSFNQYAGASNWNEFYKSGTAGEGVLYDDVKAAYEKTVAKYGSGVYDGTSKPFMDKRFNIMFPDKMKYWLGFGKSSFTLDSDGNPLLQIEPEDYLDDQSKKLEDLFPDTCPEEDKVYFEKKIETVGATDKIKNDNELLALLYKNGMIGHEGYAYNWEIHNIKEIPDNFANGNKTITDISFLNDTKVETIGTNAFMDCSELSGDLHIPTTIKKWGENAFIGWIKLTDVYYESWGHYRSIVRGGANPGINVTDSKLFIAGELITSVTLEKNDGAFIFCGYRSIVSVTFASDVVKIPQFAFNNTSLKKVIISDSIVEVGSLSFAQCTSLEKIVFGINITKLGGNILNNTPKDCIVLFKGKTPPQLTNNYLLGRATDSAIYVPVQSLALYKAADRWNIYTNFIPYNMDCDPLGLISDNGARECYCPMSNLDVIEEANYDSGTFKAVSGTAEDTEITMRHYLSDETYTEETWTVKSDLTISK